MFWLGQLLDSAHYQALPAKSVTDARVLLRLPLEVSLVIIGQNVENAGELLEELRTSRGALPIIYLFHEGEPPPGAAADHCKTRSRDTAKWLHTVQWVLSPGLPRGGTSTPT